MVVAIIAAVGIFIATVGASNGGTGNIGIGGNGSGDNLGTTDTAITSISISSRPNKTTYYVGDMVDYEGLSVCVVRNNYNDAYVKYVDSPEEFAITGFDSSAPISEQTITVEYKGFTASFTIKVLEIPTAKPTLTSIYLDPAPRDTAKAGISLSVKDARIVCVYSDGSEKSVKLLHEHLYGYENELINAQVGDVITVYERYTEYLCLQHIDVLL